MDKTLEFKLKGVIPCPACEKEFIFAYEDAKGHASVPCIRCGRISMVDYNELNAKLISPKKKRSVRSHPKT